MATVKRPARLTFTVPLLFSPMVAGGIVLWLSVHYFDLKEGIPVTMHLLSLAFLAFWAWAGSRFATLNLGKLYNFLLGNSAIIQSFLFLFFFGGKPGANIINKWLTLISSLYKVPVVYLLQGGLFLMFGNLPAWYGKISGFLAALLQIAAFSLGFFCKGKKLSS